MSYRNKKLKKVLIWLLTSGVVFSMSFLSMIGFLSIYAFWPLAIIAFIFSGVIETKVYKKNISGAIKSIFHPQSIKERIILDLFEEKYGKSNNYSCISSLEDYESYLEAKNEYEVYKNSKFHGYLEQSRKDCLDESYEKMLNARKELLNSIIQEEEYADLIATAEKKAKLSYVLSVVSFIGGIGAGFATAFGISEGILFTTAFFSLTVTTTFMSFAIWPFAIFAFLGYFCLLQKTFLDIIEKKLFDRIGQKLKAIFSRQDNQSLVFYGGKVILVSCFLVLIAGLSIFATVATAGTWWFAIQKGASLIPYIKMAADWVRNITIAGVAVTQLAFNGKNSLQTGMQLADFKPWNMIKRKWTQLVDKVKKMYEKEHIIQFCNPFRLLQFLIELVLEIVIPLGHFTADGLSTNTVKMGSYQMDPKTATLLGGASEGMVDIHYLSEGEHEFDHEHKQPQKAHEHHGHSHGDSIKFFIRFVLTISLVSPLNALWNYSASQLSANPLTLRQAFRKAYDIHEHQSTDLSSYTPKQRKQLAKHLIERQKKRLEKTFFKEDVAHTKLNAWTNINIDQVLEPKVNTSLKKSEVLNQHRVFSFFGHKKTQSQKAFEALEEICSVTRCNS